MRLKLVSVVFSIIVAGFAGNAVAAPIELENDASVSWANDPECELIPARCEPLILGAPRFVSNMSSARDLLLFTLDFHDVSVSFSEVFPNVLTLNIGDAAGNQVLRPGESTPLQLSYSIPLSSVNPNGGLLPANDLTVNLGSFVGFDLLPAGDLLFTVDLRLRLDLPSSAVFTPGDGRTQPATLNITGPGTPVSVPEPATIVLLLAGLASAGLGARWRAVQPTRDRNA